MSHTNPMMKSFQKQGSNSFSNMSADLDFLQNTLKNNQYGNPENMYSDVHIKTIPSKH